MRVLDLFSGIGGFSLGLERAGMRTVAFCEIEPYCRAVLARHWPDVDCYHDVTQLDAAELIRRHGPIDVICGGFPCQDISAAGSGAGLAGARSGLWFHFARLIRDIGPRFVVIENVSALKTRGLDIVLGHLATLGFNAEWHCIPAAYAGAPHRRDRIWIVAYADGRRFESERQPEHREQQSASGSEPDGCGEAGRRDGPHMGDADSARPQKRQTAIPSGQSWPDGRGAPERASWWQPEPDVGRVADGVPNRVDRLKALGNAVIPQIPEMIGRAIMVKSQ